MFGPGLPFNNPATGLPTVPNSNLLRVLRKGRALENGRGVWWSASALGYGGVSGPNHKRVGPWLRRLRDHYRALERSGSRGRSMWRLTAHGHHILELANEEASSAES